jgi:hypothetical protein
MGAFSVSVPCFFENGSSSRVVYSSSLMTGRDGSRTGVQTALDEVLGRESKERRDDA